jgi:hypothetical protein
VVAQPILEISYQRRDASGAIASTDLLVRESIDKLKEAWQRPLRW